MRFNLTLLLVAAGFLTGCEDDVTAPGAETFTAALNGANERPTPLPTSATGAGSFTLSADRNTFTWSITLTGATNVVASHIHFGGASIGGGPIVLPLYGAAKANNPSISGSVTRAAFLSPLGVSFDTLIALLESGDAYVNIHTDDGVAPANTGPGDYPSGEIRGQIIRQ